MKKGLSIFNAAKWVVILISITIFAVFVIQIKSPYKEIATALVNTFLFYVVQHRIQKTNTGNKLPKSGRAVGSAEHQAK